jgi:hypothetical protein
MASFCAQPVVLICSGYGEICFSVLIHRPECQSLVCKSFRWRQAASVVWLPVFLAIDRGPGFDSGATRLSEKQWVRNGVYSESWRWLRSYLNKKQRPRSRKPRLTALGTHCADNATPSTRKSWSGRGDRSVQFASGLIATEFIFGFRRMWRHNGA